MPPPVKRSLEGVLSALRQDVDSLLQRPPGSGSGRGADSVSWGNVLGKPLTFPPMIGPNADEAVAGNDARLTNARTPTAHTHPSSQITDFATAVPAAVPSATTSTEGKVELATVAEATAGTDTTRAVTAAGVAAAISTSAPTVPAASDTVAGKVELATSAEAIAGTDAARAVTPVALAAALLSKVYPVGVIFMSTVNTNPGAYLGGTWVAWGAGRVPVGVDAGQAEFNTVEKTGGAKAHTLTIAEMPSHSHQWVAAGTNNPGSTPANWDDLVGANAFGLGTGPSDPESSGNGIKPRGGGGAHNNLQPYITCYMWKRTA